MFRRMRSFAIAAAVVASLSAAASGQPVGGRTIYRLADTSTFQQGCFPPCLCPILNPVGVRGTFVLTLKESNPLFTTYNVSQVNWIIALGDSETHVMGSGTYKVGGEFAITQQLELDLKLGDEPVQHFDSGLVVGGGRFPEINITISMNQMLCFDKVFALDAAPVPADKLTPYALIDGSTFQQGCFDGPCDCPPGPEVPLGGKLVLVPLTNNGLFAEFAVATFRARANGAYGNAVVTGSGIYKFGGEFAALHQLTLYVNVSNTGPLTLDSGLTIGGNGFPTIDIAVSIPGVVCVDTILNILAAPVRP